MLQLESFTFGPFQENTYVLYDDSEEGIIVDPGCYQDVENQQLVRFINDKQITVKKIANTHCHIDHVLGNEFTKIKFKAPLVVPEGEIEVLKSVKSYAPVYGFPLYQEAEVDEFLEAPGSLSFGNTIFEVIFVPGHSPGHVAFYHKESKICIGGDVLFYGSIGRTDLPGGDHQTLIDSIHTKMFALPDDVTVYSGHGPPTTIGHEKQSNPFCAVI